MKKILQVIAASYKHWQEFKRWMNETPDGRRFGICVIIMLLIYTISLGITNAQAAAYGYDDQIECQEDASDSRRSRWQEKFNTEKGLIANGTRKYYRLDSEPNQCFEVPQDLRKEATIYTTATATTNAVAITVTASAAGVAGIIAGHVTKIAAAIVGAAVWEVAGRASKGAIKTPIEGFVSAHQSMTEEQLIDPCGSMMRISIPAYGIGGGVEVGPLQTAILNECRQAVPISTTIDPNLRKRVSNPNLKEPEDYINEDAEDQVDRTDPFRIEEWEEWQDYYEDE